jgi:phosphatidylinositol-3-phosphatase
MRTRMAALMAAVPLLFGSTAAVTAPTGAAAMVSPAAASGPCGTLTTAPAYKHVIVIMMENHSYNTIIGSSQAPYINSLATKCGLATNYHNVSHPSLPNYIAATSGLGYKHLTKFDRDCNPVPGCTTSSHSIFAQGESWKAYEESMPSKCHKSNSSEYAVRHDPPPYYTTLSGCARNDVPFTRLATDLAAGTLPAYSFITPNLIDDMHDGTVADGDKWLSANLPTILNSPEYTNGSTVVFLTWDEGENGSFADGEHCATNTSDVSCHVATLVISPSTRPGTKSARLFNHYSLLGTAEQLLGLPKLGKASSATTMTAAFNL